MPQDNKYNFSIVPIGAPILYSKYKLFVFNGSSYIGYYDVWIDETHLSVNYTEEDGGKTHSLASGWRTKAVSAARVVLDDMKERGFNTDRFVIAMREIQDSDFMLI